jgi:hypothetical protein
MLEFYQRYLRRKRRVPQVRLEWKDTNWCYIIKDGKSVGHIYYFIVDERVETQVKNLLKQLEK